MCDMGAEPAKASGGMWPGSLLSEDWEKKNRASLVQL